GDRARSERGSSVRFGGRCAREGRAARQGEDGDHGGCSVSSNGEVKFLTHEVGSLAKPPWLVKTSAGKPLEESDIEHARKWGDRLEVDGHEQLVELLRQDERDPDEIARWS